MTTHNLMWSLVVALIAGVARAEAPALKAANVKAAAVARRAWTITDLVLEQDIDPPARQQMLLHGVKALLRRAPGRTMPNLSARVSGVTTLEQFAALLAEVWPAGDAKGEEREHVLFQGLFDIKEYKADRDCLFRAMPMVVLVGEYTGAMPRVLAAALQDRGRAVVVGGLTKPGLFVTSLVPLPDGQGSLLLRTGTVERDKDPDVPVVNLLNAHPGTL